MFEVNERKLMGIGNGNERYATSTAEFKRICGGLVSCLSARDEWANILSLGPVLVGQELRMDPGLMSRILSGKRSFGMPPQQTALFCYRFLSTSCHEVFFGHEKATRLPKTLSTYVKMLMEMSGEYQNLVFDKMNELLEAHGREPYSVGAWEHSCDKQRFWDEILDTNHTAMVKSRLIEAGEDRGRVIQSLFGDPWPRYLTDTINSYLGNKNRKTEGSKSREFKARIYSLMYIAMCLDTTLDQFCTVDYTVFTDVKLFDSDIIAPTGLKNKFVSPYLRLPEEAQRKSAEFVIRMSQMSDIPRG